MATNNGGFAGWAVPVLAAGATTAALLALVPAARPAAPAVAAALGVAAASVAIADAAARRSREGAHVRTHDEAARDLAAVRDRVALLEQIFDATSEGLLLMGADGGPRLANGAARAMLSLGPRASSPAIEALDLPDLAARVIRAQEPLTAERVLHFPARRTLRMRVLPFDEGALVLLTDVTAQNRVDEVRRDFVANVSHELKTPVTGIALIAEQLSHAIEENPQAARRFAERIHFEADRLGRLVTDLLDLSRVESAMPLEIGPLEPVTLVHEAVARVATLAEAKGITVSIDAEGAIPSFEADATLAGAALANLLDNAVRYSPDGSPVRIAIEPGDGEVRFVVSDDGPGIPTEELGRIFERFYRVDKARARATGGTGLGLAIVKHAAERHGGRVSAESQLGRGSRFTLAFPIAPTPGDDA